MTAPAKPGLKAAAAPVYDATGCQTALVGPALQTGLGVMTEVAQTGPTAAQVAAAG